MGPGLPGPISVVHGGDDTVSEDEGKTERRDPAVVAADAYKPLMENNRVRVLDVRLEPGQEAPMHDHPDHVLYVFTDCTFKITLPDGSGYELPLKAGQVLWGSAEAHAAKNIGTGEAHTLAIELKE